MEQEQQQQTKGIGKESQLSKIAAAVNPSSQTEANPEATKSMISTFIKHFDSVALELINEMDDDQEKLVKKMVDEITKLQSKNIEEFQKAIGKIVGIANNMIESNNPKLQEMGQGLKDQATNELFKAKGITLTGEKDTFMNRLGRQVGMNTEEDPAQGKQGIGKIAKSAFSNIGRELKRGVGIAVGADIEQEGTFYDRVVRSDEEKRSRELSRLEQSSSETKTESLSETFKRSIEELIKEVRKADKTEGTAGEKSTDKTDNAEENESERSAGKTDAQTTDAPTTKKLSEKMDSGIAQASSEAQEDAAGISKDARVEALQSTSESNLIIQEKTTESADTLTKILEEIKKIAELMINNNQASGGAAPADGGDPGGDMLDIDLPGRRRSRSVRGRIARGARSLGARAANIGRSVVSGARSLGGAVLSRGGAIARGVGGLLGFGTAAAGAAGTAGLGATGAAGATGLAATGAAGATGAATAGAAGATGLAATGAAGATGLAATGAAGAAGAAASKPGILGKIASGARGLASKAGNVVGSVASGVGGSGVLKGAARVAGKLALPLAAGMAVYDGYKGFNADPNATTGQKFKNAGRNVLSGLTFGLVDSTEDKMAAGEYTGTQKKPAAKGTAEKPQQGLFSKAMEMASNNKGLMAGAALGPAGMLGGALYDKMSGTNARAETGKNVDGALIEAGTEATKEKMQINVPPPTVINQGGGGGGNSAPTITAPGGVRNVRSDDPTWLMFQKRRAVA
jgi:hypothetical protein